MIRVGEDVQLAFLVAAARIELPAVVAGDEAVAVTVDQADGNIAHGDAPDGACRPDIVAVPVLCHQLRQQGDGVRGYAHLTEDLLDQCLRIHKGTVRDDQIRLLPVQYHQSRGRAHGLAVEGDGAAMSVS